MVKKIYLNSRSAEKTYVLVDDEDYERLNKYKWHRHSGGYAVRNNKNGYPKNVYMHRDIMSVINNPNVEVDHKDGNINNYQKENLRVCTRTENCRNVSKVKKNTSSKYKGVHKLRQSWVANIKTNKKVIRIGSFRSEEAAAFAYDVEARKLFGEFAKTNFDYVDWQKIEQDRIVRKLTDYFGVKVERETKYVARLYIDGKNKRLKTFDNPEDAALCYDMYVRKLGLDKKLNFPDNYKYDEAKLTYRRKEKTSKYPKVFYHKRGYWISTYKDPTTGKIKEVGYFQTEEDAYQAQQLKLQELGLN